MDYIYFLYPQKFRQTDIQIIRITPDCERIEIDYRSGVMSLRAIADAHGITEGAIRKRAKRDEWARDLAAKIKAKTDDLVRKQAVRSEVRTQNCVPEKEVIDANAKMQADIILAHRTDIPRYRNLVNTMMKELETETENTELFERLGELMASTDEKGYDKLNEIYRKVISLPSRVYSKTDVN
jgi:hypothetical protein